MKYRDPQTGEFKDITVKVADTLPVGTIVEYDGTTVPNGWEQIEPQVDPVENISINDFFISSTKTITDYSIVKTGNIINIQRMVIPSISKGNNLNIAQVNPKYKPKGGKAIRILASVDGGGRINGILFINSDGSIEIINNAEANNLNAYIFNATYIIDEEATI